MRIYTYAIVIALSALFFGILIRMKPEIVFNIPNFGYIVYTSLTGIPPPHHLVIDWFDDFSSFVYDGDVIVSTGPKCGTTMMLYWSHLIRVKGKEDIYPFRDVTCATPWPSLRHKPGQTWNDIKQLMYTTILPDGTKLVDLWDNKDYPFRIFKAHELPKDCGLNISSCVVPIKSHPKVKFVAMSRTFSDVAVSYYRHRNSICPDFRRMWGGYPSAVKDSDEMMKTIYRMQDYLLAYPKGWWAVRNEPNVLLLHYNDVISDVPGSIRKLARFYEVDLTEEEVAIIAEKGSFASMKKMTSKFSYMLWGNKAFKGGEGHVFQEEAFLGKGVIGSGKFFFSEQQLSEISALEEKHFGDDPELLEWSRHGGDLQMQPNK